jgi:hypothetical protein
MNVTPGTVGPRWEHYFLRRGEECSDFWKDFLSTSKRRILFVLGLGFDPRMCFGLETFVKVSPACVNDCLLIKYDEGDNSPSNQYRDLVKDNLCKLTDLIGKTGTIKEAEVPMWSADKRRRIGSRRAGEVIKDATIKAFTDIVVDISAMPRGIYFPVLAKILYLLDSNTDHTYSSKNLHVLVPEHVLLDRSIQEEGIDENASYMHGFQSDLVQEATANVPKIWIPILGEGKEAQLIRLYHHIRPDEICPVFPSPSVRPRRVDDLVAEYRELLFDSLRVEPTNFVYASEWNPFEVYRQIYGTVKRYNEALEALGNCKVVISALSSKLLSVGALLAAYEAKRKGFMVGISHVQTHGYKITEKIDLCKPELFSLWIAGECYNA